MIVQSKRLSVYQLSCGEVQRATDNQTLIGVVLWKENNLYHIRVHDHAEHLRLVWETRYTLTEARKVYSQFKRMYLN